MKGEQSLVDMKVILRAFCAGVSVSVWVWCGWYPPHVSQPLGRSRLDRTPRPQLWTQRCWSPVQSTRWWSPSTHPQLSSGASATSHTLLPHTSCRCVCSCASVSIVRSALCVCCICVYYLHARVHPVTSSSGGPRGAGDCGAHHEQEVLHAAANTHSAAGMPGPGA